MSVGSNMVINEVVDKLESTSSENNSYIDSKSIVTDSEDGSNNDAGSDIVPQDLEDSQLVSKLSDLQFLYVKQSVNIEALELTELNRLQTMKEKEQKDKIETANVNQAKTRSVATIKSTE